MLHAWRLGFRHPFTGEAVSFESPLPQDMSQLISKLRGSEVQRFMGSEFKG
jgi:23S rRNA pseudouridine1911/1915/1917 synthase